jgi:hypothetical protein
VGKRFAVNRMFKLNLIKDNVSVYIVDSYSLCYARLGHINYNSMNGMVKLRLLPSNLQDDIDKCEICVKTKLTRKPLSSVNRSSSNLLELIHSDICDLSGKITRGGKKKLITFIDDFSKYTYIYLIRTKDEAFNMFKIYKAEVENIIGCKIRSLRSDRGGEYFNNDFDNFCEINVIIHERTTPLMCKLTCTRNSTNREVL